MQFLSPTTGPFDPDPPERLFENYIAFMEEGWSCGKIDTGGLSRA